VIAVAWAAGQPRTAALARALGGDAVFLTSRLPGRPATAPLRHLSAAVRTWRLLERRAPAAVLVVAPPVAAPMVAALWCRLRQRPLVVDCHTGAFHARRWAWARPLYRLLLPGCRAVLVHTGEALALVQSWGARGLLLPDDVPDDVPDPDCPNGPDGRATVLVAGSLDENEPVGETLAAAALAPEVRFLVTGDPRRVRRGVRASAPPNVVFTGFLPHPRFLAEMREAGAVAAFSTDPHIMNRAAFEAVGLGRPLVLSDLSGLRERFGRAALFAPNRPDAMADAVREALAERAELGARSRALAADLRRQHHGALARLRAALDGAPSAQAPTRVLRITRHEFPADSIVRRDVLELAARGVHVDVVCGAGPGGDEPVAGPVRVHRIPVPHRRGGAAGYVLEYAAFCLAALAVASWLGLRHRYAAVQADNLPDLLAFAGAVPRLRGARLVLTLYELTPEMVAARFGGRAGGDQLVAAARLVEAAATGWADHVIAVSEPCRRALLDRGVPGRRVSVVLNTTPWSDGRPEPDPARAGSWSLVTHTTLVERYGVHVAIRALAMLGHRWPDLTLRVVGDGEQRAALRDLAAGAGVGDRVVFTGRLPWADTLAEVGRSRLGIVPVLADGYGELLLPTKLLEYAWLGVPAVCSRLPAIEAYFPPDAVAYARPGDADDLARRIDELLRRPDDAEARARRASEIARGLAWERVRGEYLAALGLPPEGSRTCPD
jgi:glycosyltransferase involved in cell wall biosynthesis